LQVEACAESAGGDPIKKLLVKGLAGLRVVAQKFPSGEESATVLTILLGNFTPKRPLMAAPSSGSSGIIHKCSSMGIRV
jgi:hypothetical protein